LPDSIELKIDKLVYGGDGLGHHDGHAVFVPFVLPGETVAIEAAGRHKKFIRGRLTRVTEHSPSRILAPCPYFGICGGCNYQHIPYELQLSYKSDILRETLSRLGRVAWDGPIVTHGSPPFAYRNRAQWKIGRGPSGASAIGYFEAGSQRFCAVEQCPIVSPHLAQTLAALGEMLHASKLPSTLSEIEAFVDDADARLLLNLSFESLNIPGESLVATLRSELPSLATVLLHDRKQDAFQLDGPGHLAYRVGGHEYLVGQLSFFQANRFLLPELVDVVLGDAHGGLALDLFAGVGLFTVPLADRFQRAIAVEANVAAARDLEANLHQSGAPAPTFRRANVEEFLARWHDKPDFVVLDPPRAGVAPPALARLIKLAPQAISYLSCDPATLARDLAALVGKVGESGAYAISELHLVDMFPQTYHMEVLVRLVRRA